MGKSGKKARLVIGGQDLTENLNSISFDEVTDNIETTTFGKDSKTYIEGLDDATMSASGNWTPALQTKLDAIKVLQKANGYVAYTYAPLNEVGQPQFSGNLIITSRGISGDVGDKINIELSMQNTGDVSVDAILS